MKNLNAAPKAQFFSTAGDPLVGGKLYTYVAGTSTPQATYTTEAGVTANTNPIILDSRGECNLFLTESVSYKFILYDSTDVLIWSVDNVSSLSGLATQSASAVAITGGTISGVAITGGTISGLTSPLPIASGGTNAITAAAARTSLGLGTYAVVNVPTASAANVLLGDAISTVAPGAALNLLTSTGTAWASTAPATPVGAIKAWGVFDGTAGSPTCSASGNVTSITKNGTGDYTVTFTTALSSANYVVSIMAQGTTGNNSIMVLPFFGPSATTAAPTTTTFRFMVVIPGTGFVDSARITFSVIS